MKINRKNPAHWLHLSIFTLNTVISLLLRVFIRTPPKPVVVLYGHKLNSNLLSLYLTNQRREVSVVAVKYLTMDSTYYKHLKQNGIDAVCGIYPNSILVLARASILVSDHGLHCLSLLLKFSSIKFADVWHGIPFKGFDADDFATQRKYQETWVPSKLLGKLYIEKFGFEPTRIVVTGYGRTDLLINPSDNVSHIKRHLGIPDDTRKVILFAPTWQQDDDQRSIFPFNTSEQEFSAMIRLVCQKNNTILIFRTHLNSNLNTLSTGDPFYFIPHDLFPDTESILTISDIMICDWSSIAFDFLTLNRPTIFLDVPHPFAKGFSLGPEYRFGKIVQNISQLQQSINTYLRSPEKYQEEFGQKAQSIIEKLYDETLDGESAARYLHQAEQMIHRPE